MIVARDISKSFPHAPEPVLKDICLEIQDGDFVSLVGKSGSGKSTLLYILSTLDRPTRGEVLFDDRPLHQFSADEIYRLRNRDIGFVFQFHYLLSELTAVENILLPAIKARETGQRRSFALELLKTVGLSGKEERYPGELSGGEQQRLAIARALVMKPRYLFADEPTGNLDSGNAKIVMDLFGKINREQGTTIIYVTHDIEFAAIAEKKISLVDGEIPEHQESN